MRFKNCRNNVVINNTTVTRNGKVLSPDDPGVKETIANIQNKFGKYLGNDFFQNILNDTVDGDLMDNQEDIEELSDMEEEHHGFVGAFSSHAQQKSPSVVKCINCGANNIITAGSQAVCEYCGSGLEC